MGALKVTAYLEFTETPQERTRRQKKLREATDTKEVRDAILEALKQHLPPFLGMVMEAKRRDEARRSAAAEQREAELRAEAELREARRKRPGRDVRQARCGSVHPGGGAQPFCCEPPGHYPETPHRGNGSMAHVVWDNGDGALPDDEDLDDEDELDADFEDGADNDDTCATDGPDVDMGDGGDCGGDCGDGGDCGGDCGDESTCGDAGDAFALPAEALAPPPTEPVRIRRTRKKS